MARRTEEEKLAALSAKRKAIEAQIQAVTARQKERVRKDDTRRKILAGAVILAEAEKTPAAKQRFMALLDQHLVRDIDRAVFDLPPKVASGTPSESVSTAA